MFALLVVLGIAAGSTGALAASAAGGSALQNVQFTDLSHDPYAPAIDVLAGMGIVRGVSNGAFQPQAPVTRQQLAVFAVRLLGQQASAEALNGAVPQFSDASSISSWAVGDVNFVQSLGLMSGFPDGTFRPKATVTEATAITVLVRILGGGNYADATGRSWPASYLRAARSLGLLKSVRLQSPHGAAPIRRDELAQLIFNAGMTHLLTYDSLGNAILPPSGRQLFATTGWEVHLNAVVTSTHDGTISFGGPSLPLAAQITVVGTQDASLADLKGQTVDYTVDVSGRVNSVELAPATSQSLILNADPSVARTAAAGIGGRIYAGTTYAVRSGSNFFALVRADGGLLPLWNRTIPIRLNGVPVKLAGAVPHPGRDLVRASLDAAGSVTSVHVTNYGRVGLLVTGTEGLWADPEGGGVSINFYRPHSGPSAVIIPLQPHVTTYLNGDAVDPKTFYEALQIDAQAGIYPVLSIAGPLSSPYALSVWDHEVIGTVLSATTIAPGRTMLRLSTGAGPTVILRVAPGAWQASALPPSARTLSPGWFGSTPAQAGKPAVYTVENGRVAWSWPVPRPLAAGDRVVELRSAQEDARGDVTWTVDYRGQTYTLNNDPGGQMTLNANPGAFYLVQVHKDGGVTTVQPLTEDATAGGTPYAYTVQLVTNGAKGSGQHVGQVTLAGTSLPPGGTFVTHPATTFHAPLVYGPPSTVVSPYKGSLQVGTTVHVWYDHTRKHIVLQAGS